MIDSHCHLDYEDFDADRAAMLQRAADAGVSGLLTVGTRPEEWPRAFAVAREFPAVRVALGLHPHEAERYTPDLKAQLRALIQSNAGVLAVGETGLDFFRNLAPREKQFAAFRAQLELAAELRLPFILHSRAAEAEVFEVLGEFAPLRGVWHCFSSTREYAARAAALGLYFGIGGIVTYPKADEVRAAVAALPADRILLETDCPFLPPQPWRGKRNEPAYLTKVVETIAAVRGTTPEEIDRLTTENARALFGTW
jgi:TatD DNase family protein